jgi:hypothetical protein
MSKFYMMGAAVIAVSVAVVAWGCRPVRTSDDLLGKAQAEFEMKARDALIQRRMTQVAPAPAAPSAPASVPEPTYAVASLEPVVPPTIAAPSAPVVAAAPEAPTVTADSLDAAGRIAQIVRAARAPGCAGGRGQEGNRIADGVAAGAAGYRKRCDAESGSGRCTDARGGDGHHASRYPDRRRDTSRACEGHTQNVPCIARAEGERRRSSLRSRRGQIFDAVQPSGVARTRTGNRRRDRPVYVGGACFGRGCGRSCRSLQKMSCTLLVSAVPPATSCRLNQS